MPLLLFVFFLPNVRGEDGFEPGEMMRYIGVRVLFARIIGTVISVPFWVWLSLYIGKFRSAFIGNACRSFQLFFSGMFIWHGSDLRWVVLSQFLSGLSFGSNALGPVILNEVIDYDTFLSGRKREAMFQ